MTSVIVSRNLRLSMENQTYICYPMPMRTMGYDHTAYQRKYTGNARQLAKDKTLNRHEYLSGMKRTDRFSPVITVTVYFGTDPWDGALSLKELFDLKDERLLQYVQDYRVLLIEPDRMRDADFVKFSTSLGAVLQFMKAAQDKRKLKEFVNGNEVFRRLGRKAARVIRDCANVIIDIETSEEVVNVCKGWEDAIEDARLEEREAAKNIIISNAVGIYREMNVAEPDKDALMKQA